jgi:hypothetical protein
MRCWTSRNSATMPSKANGASGWPTDRWTIVWTTGRTAVPGTTPASTMGLVAIGLLAGCTAAAGAGRAASVWAVFRWRGMTGPMNRGAFGAFGPMNGAATAGRCGSAAGGAATPVWAGAGRDEDVRGDGDGDADADADGDGDGDTRGEVDRDGDAVGLLRLLPLPLPLPLPLLLLVLEALGEALAVGQPQRCAAVGEGLAVGCLLLLWLDPP